MANDTAKMAAERFDAETIRMIEKFADNVRSNNSFINAAKGVPPTPSFADPDFEMYPAFGHENEALGRPLKAQSNTANGIADLRAWIVQCERTIAGFRAVHADKDAEIATLRAELDQAKQAICQPAPDPSTGGEFVNKPTDNPLARRFRGGLGQAFEDRS